MRWENVLLIRLPNNRRYKYCISERPGGAVASAHTHHCMPARIFRLVFGAPPLLLCFFLLLFCFFFTSGVALAQEEEVENDRRHSCPRSAGEWCAYMGRNELYVGTPTGWIFLCYVRRIRTVSSVTVFHLLHLYHRLYNKIRHFLYSSHNI